MKPETSYEPNRLVSSDLVPLSSSTIYVARSGWEDDVIEADAYEICLRPDDHLAEYEPPLPNYVSTPPRRGAPGDFDRRWFRCGAPRDEFGRARRPRIHYRWYQRRPRIILSLTADRHGWHLFVSHKARRVICIVMVVLTFALIGRLSEAVQFLLGTLF
jgi:hypothetical protein